MISNISILRCKQVQKMTGLSRSSIYLRIQEGTFPRQINLGARAVGWIQKEIEDWLAVRIELRNKNDSSDHNRNIEFLKRPSGGK